MKIALLVSSAFAGLTVTPTATHMDLLKKWGLHKFSGVFEEHGWDVVDGWKDLTKQDMQEMGMKNGHISTFKRKFAMLGEAETAVSSHGRSLSDKKDSVAKSKCLASIIAQTSKNTKCVARECATFTSGIVANKKIVTSILDELDDLGHASNKDSADEKVHPMTIRLNNIDGQLRSIVSGIAKIQSSVLKLQSAGCKSPKLISQRNGGYFSSSAGSTHHCNKGPSGCWGTNGAFDGSNSNSGSTCWATRGENVNCWIEINFKQVMLITHYYFSPRSHGTERSSKHRLNGSGGSGSWTVNMGVSTNWSINGPYNLKNGNSAREAKKIRVTITENKTGRAPNNGFCELRFYGCPK